jgi:methyl-accepting chemotaxis protein
MKRKLVLAVLFLLIAVLLSVATVAVLVGDYVAVAVVVALLAVLALAGALTLASGRVRHYLRGLVAMPHASRASVESLAQIQGQLRALAKAVDRLEKLVNESSQATRETEAVSRETARSLVLLASAVDEEIARLARTVEGGPSMRYRP